ncbi:MAG TPA: copper oxidase [Desulfobulbaceae bacterium]|nr:copper oxidase [Desulfobulbaceae bacterium]
MTTHLTPSLTLLKGCKLQTPHGMLNREGGNSPPPFASMNLSYGVGDRPDNVAANRQLVKQALGATFLVSAGQVHGDRIFCVEETDQDMEVQGYDALMTNRSGIGLLIQQADCQAVLLHDPDRNAVAAIHCGWRGNVCNIIATVVERMRREYRSDPRSLHALISPSLGPCCAEFKDFTNEFPPELHCFQDRPHYFDLWRLSAVQLTGAGVITEHIEIMGICTACSPEYFSYRRSRRKGLPATGRNGSAILLQRKETLSAEQLSGIHPESGRDERA